MTKKLSYKAITKTIWELYGEIVRTDGTDKNFMNHIYSWVAEQLFFVGEYEEEQIQHFFKFQYDELTPDYNQDEEHYTKYKSMGQYVQHLIDNMDNEHEQLIQDNEELMDKLFEFETIIIALLPKDEEPETNKQMKEIIKNNSNEIKIKQILLDFENGKIERGQIERKKIELIELLEQEENMFLVEFPDKNQRDGFKSKYYFIDPNTKSYEQNTKNKLKQLFNDKYGVKLHKGNDFFYNILERTCNYKEEQTHIVEMENVYIDRRNYEITQKNDDNIIFTTDRLSYNTYDTHELQLFHYTEGVRLDDVLTGKVEMSFPMERIKEIFVPKTNQEETNKLLLFMQYLGMMVIGRNPTKLSLILYDEENERTGNKGRTTLFQMLKTCFPNTFVRVGQEVFKDQFKIETYSRGKHGLFMDENDKDTLIKFHTEIKEVLNGSGSSGGAMYTREQKQIESLPLIIGSNGVPDAPLSDTALLSRLLLIELPNQFVDETKVEETTDTYPKITNLDDLIQQHVDELGQVISIAINEYRALDMSRSLDGQLAIQPNIDRTIQILTSNNIIMNLLHTYTKPVARGTDVVNDWVTTTEIQATLSEAYKRATDKPMDKQEINPKKIGTLILQLYPRFMSEKEPNNNAHINKKKKNGKMYYNITLHTLEEVQQKENEILTVLPLGEHKIFGTLEKNIYNKIEEGVNTISKLRNELEETYTIKDIEEALEELYKSGLIDWTGNQNFIE
ncbi:hypothetical protein [Methanosphaera sp.]|uniref:hypothetical protein n=1 Tax=Methanosphaera sp. TaxID=2666342 RepID=UPI0025F5AA01|nr:hypothetical protein [Methanosphaera sp.]